jgi:5-methylcytosine-specific restriction endonuclease McrA
VCAWQKNAAYSPERPRGRRWMKTRRMVMARAGGVCERCEDRLADEIHHLDGLKDNRLEALLAVCHSCHRAL